MDRLIGAKRTDITILDKETREFQVIDITYPGDNKVAEKEDEKIENYRNLAREASKLWNVGTVPRMFERRMKDIGISIKTDQIQKLLFGTARILRKVLEI